MMSNSEKQNDNGGKHLQRDAVVNKVLDGADDVTRRKMDAMLERSSVVEVMAQAHASGKPAGIEDRPIKPDFLNTEQYQLARDAIGAKGEPAPIEPDTSDASPWQKDADGAPDADALPSSLAPSNGTGSTPPPPEDDTKRIFAVVAVVAGVVIGAIMLWPRGRPADTEPASSASTGSTQAASSASVSAPEPSAASSATAGTSTDHPTPSTPTKPGPPLSPISKPAPNPSAKPATSAPAPSSTSRFVVQGDD